MSLIDVDRADPLPSEHGAGSPSKIGGEGGGPRIVAGWVRLGVAPERRRSRFCDMTTCLGPEFREINGCSSNFCVSSPQSSFDPLAYISGVGLICFFPAFIVCVVVERERVG